MAVCGQGTAWLALGGYSAQGLLTPRLLGWRGIIEGHNLMLTPKLPAICPPPLRPPRFGS